jgi:hypothetical protein
MRRTAAVLVSTFALVAGLASPSSADTTYVARKLAVDLATFVADGIPIDGTGCGADFWPANEGPTFDIADTPLDTNAPSASRVWTESFPTSDLTGASYGPMFFPDNSSQLAVFMMDVYNGTDGQAVVYYYNADGSGYVGRAAVSGTANAWAQVSGANLTYTWTPFDTYFDVSGPTTSATISAFAVLHGQAQGGWSAAIEFGCDANDFAFQNTVYGDTPGDLTVVDYEDLTNDVVSKPSASFVKAGAAMTIGGSSQYGGPSSASLVYRDPTMSAYATAHSSVSATSVADVTCDDDFVVCRNNFSGVGMHPKYNVVYRWCYGSTVAVTAACGSFATIHVQAVISPAFPSAIVNGRAFSVSGKINPLRPGTQVTLWGKKGTTTTRLGVATVSSTGTYKFTATVRSAGTWSLWVTSPNDKYNAAGKSATKAYTVR